MDIISQEDAKIKIKDWLLLGETDDQIKEKLANYGFVDVVADNLLNEARPITDSTPINSNPTLVSSEAPLFNSEVLSKPTEVLSQTPTNILQNNKSESKSKYVIYFLIGFIIPLLGLLIGSLAVVVKEKQNKGKKFIVLLLASIFSLFFWNMVAGGASFSVSVTEPSFPALQTVGNDLKSFALDKQIVLSYTKFDQPVTLGTNTFSSLLNAKVLSNKKVTLMEISNIGKQICSSLEKTGISVEAVQVEVTETKFFIIKTSVGTGGSCSEWLTDKVYNDFIK